jgi:hypothetical protein
MGDRPSLSAWGLSLLVSVLGTLGSGCAQLHHYHLSCDEKCEVTEPEGKCETPVCEPKCEPKCEVKCPPPECPAPRTPPCPAPAPTVVPAPAPKIEVRQQPTVTIKVPQRQVVIEQPTPTLAMQAPPMAAPMAAPTAAPMASQPMYAPAPAAYAPVSALGGSVQSVPSGRARPGLTIDFFNLPIPFPRLIAVPTSPEITVPVAAPQYVAYAPQPQPVAYAPQPQPVAYAPQPQPVAYAPQAPVQPVMAAPVAPPQQTMVPVQGQVTVPVQGQVTVPVQGQVAVPISGQTPVPVSSPMVIPIQAAPAPTAAMPVTSQPLNPQDVDNFCRQVDALKAALEAQKKAAGCGEK